MPRPDDAGELAAVLRHVRDDEPPMPDLVEGAVHRGTALRRTRRIRQACAAAAVVVCAAVITPIAVDAGRSDGHRTPAAMSPAGGALAELAARHLPGVRFTGPGAKPGTLEGFSGSVRVLLTVAGRPVADRGKGAEATDAGTACADSYAPALRGSCTLDPPPPGGGHLWTFVRTDGHGGGVVLYSSDARQFTAELVSPDVPVDLRGQLPGLAALVEDPALPGVVPSGS